ncbi:MAG: GDCCVxC domain-containing (seleno)protein [Steroidobacteraceae bacterium]
MSVDFALESTLTCPHCEHQALEIMPIDACQFFYDCKGCGALLHPKSGDRCVFCSYGSVRCPSKQGRNPCCGASDPPS